MRDAIIYIYNIYEDNETVEYYIAREAGTNISFYGDLSLRLKQEEALLGHTIYAFDYTVELKHIDRLEESHG